MKRFFLLLTIFFCCHHPSLAQSLTEEKCPVTEEWAKFEPGWILNDTVIIRGKDTILARLEKKGNGIIFGFRRKFDCMDMADDQHWEELTWYIPDTAGRFKIVLKDKPYNLDYSLQYAANRFKLVSASGTISGEKVGEQWKVQGNVQVKIPRNYGSLALTSRDIIFSAKFKPGFHEQIKNKKKRNHD